MTVRELQAWLCERISGVLRILREILFGGPRLPVDSGPSRPARGTQDAVIGRLGQEVARFEREALAYCLFVEVNRQSVSDETRRAMTNRFGEAFSAPVLELTKVFRTTNEHAISDSLMKEWLGRRGCVCEGNVGIATQLEEYLLGEAQKRAVDEIRKEAQRN